MNQEFEIRKFETLLRMEEALIRIAEAIDRNTAALLQQGEPEPPDAEEHPTGGFTSLDQLDPDDDPMKDPDWEPV